MKKEEKCDQGFKGLCCCNCVHHRKLMCHPMNRPKFGYGSINKQCGWICLGLGSIAIYSDREHGMCEEHKTSTTS